MKMSSKWRSAMNDKTNPHRGHDAKLNVKLGSGCIVCEESEIVGDVTIGDGTIIHPRARILAEGGPIVIGKHNLVEDKALILNRARKEGGATPVMIIGSYNVFEVGCKTEALKIGDNNVFESKSVVGGEVEITNNCVVGVGCVLTRPETLPENCAVYGRDCTRKITQGHQPQITQMDFLSKVLPTYHQIMKKKGN